MRKNLLALIVFFLFLIFSLTGSFLIGVYFGYGNRPAIAKVTSLINKESGNSADVDFSPFWQAWNIINEKYVGANGTSTMVSDQDKVWGAIEGLTASLNDPYTVFLPPEKNKRFEEDIRGNFGGVGMEVGVKDGILTVISPLPDSPAKRAGIMAGDKIIKINETLASNLSTDEAVNLIRGEEGTSVSLLIQRGDNKTPFEVKVVRGVIAIPVIDTELLANGIFLIRLYNFSAPSADLFRQALRGFINNNTDKMIIDLRGNPGGYLDASVDIASWFLPLGKPIVVEKRGEGLEDNIYRSKGYDIFNENLKLVVLVDQGSASASEIVAGALSEYGKAKLIGEKTFGKGSVQELVPVTEDSSIKITIAKWYTPKGLSISHNGLKPDIEVPFTEDDFIAGRDPQLDRAIKELLNWQ